MDAASCVTRVRATQRKPKTMPKNANLPHPTGDHERLKANLDTWGYCLAAEALKGDVLAAVQERILTQAAAERAQGVTRQDSPVELGEMKNQWVRILTNKGRIFIDALVHNPVTRPLVHHLLGEEVLLSGLDCHITWPGNGAMGLHIDQWWLLHPVMPGERPVLKAGDIKRSRQVFCSPERSSRAINPPVVINVFYAATDFTRANGATRLIPGSHLSGAHPEPRGSYDEVQPEVPAGTAVIWDGRTWHAAGANDSDVPRAGISTYFAGPQFRQLVNLPYGTRPDVAAGLTEADRRLFGYAIWEGIGNTGGAMSGEAEPGIDKPGVLT